MKKVGELTNKEIADNLKISVKTVENQMTIAFRKLIEYISDHWK
jgi:DNA-binding CsgD family transcriptional regulator